MAVITCFGAAFEGDAEAANAREMVARRIIDLTNEGQRDRQRLRDLALASFCQLQLAYVSSPLAVPRRTNGTQRSLGSFCARS